ncbi:Cu-oxidase-domain-containing protein [Amanita rubescens]|nr:Cu-oxidase-domain-containing protein [Amanita rubescens]
MKIWALLLLAFLSSAEAALRQYTLELTNDVVAPDGFPRSAITVNHQLPGSIITANKNDQLQIEVVNNLNDSTMTQGTSVHWHGIFQNRLAAEDGVAWVTQCPIAAGDRFLYNFTVGEQTGTYWYHSHVVTQYCDGLVGPLIIYDPNDPLKGLYDVDDESTVITLMDWYHLPSPQVLQTFGFPLSHLINGRGRVADSNVSAALTVINVDPMKRYRYRLINSACFAAYNFSIDGHDLTVIEIDGTETVPHTVGVVPIFAGQRVSVVVNAFKPIGNYWIRSVPYTLGVPPSNETGINSAILRYTGANDSEPTTVQTNFNFLREQDLMPFIPSNLSHGEPDIKISLVLALIGGPKGNFSVNGVQYTPPSLPLLLQILNGNVNPHSYLPPGTVYTLPRNKLVEISVPGDSPLSPHPFHLHGHNFAVTRSGGSATVNTLNPPLRDVVSGGFGGDAGISFRFRTDNPGPWFLHCHIDFHFGRVSMIILI